MAAALHHGPVVDPVVGPVIKDCPAAPRVYAGPRLPRLRTLAPLAALGFLFAAALGATSQRAPAPPPKPSQDQVEAVYLYDFAKFVRWPAAKPGSNLEICVAAPGAYSDALNGIIHGERVDGRAAVAHPIRKPAQAGGCDILFIDQSMKGSLEGLLDAVRGKPVLTVSDVPGFLDRGGMIQFLLVGDRVRFAVNLPPVAQGGISLSSELLKVAVRVEGQPSSAAGGSLRGGGRP